MSIHNEFNLLLLESVLEHFDDGRNKVRYAIRLHVEFQHVGFQFLEVEQLVHQAQHTTCVATDDAVGMLFALGHMVVVDEAKCTRNECQRRAELMRHVGEEAHIGITHALDDRLFAQRLLDAATVAQIVGGLQSYVGDGKQSE